MASFSRSNDDLSLTELVGRLRDLHTLRTPLGWPTDDAVSKSHVERCIIDLVTRSDSQPVDDPAQRMTCELDVKVRAANLPSVAARRVTLQPGGLFIETDAAIEIGEPVEVEVIGDKGALRLRSRGTVGYRSHGKPGQPAGIGIGFKTVVGESAERRLERLVLELVRHRL